jgi:CRISPR-associated autoregulator DevR family
LKGETTRLTHVAGTFLIQAEGAFLNGAGLGDGEDRNVSVPKTFRNGKGEVPYVSAQAWKRWLRNTAIQEANWPASEPQAIGWNPRGNVNKIAGQLNPVTFPEDDIFGYMRAQEGQGKRKAAEEDIEEEEEDSGTTRAIMRSSPFMASLLISIRSSGWKGEDEGFVHLTKFDPKALAEAEVDKFLNAASEQSKTKDKKDTWKRLQAFGEDWAKEVKKLVEEPNIVALRDVLLSKATEKGVELKLNSITPLPYTTRFYNTHLQGVFCLDYARLGVFWNIGDRIELEEAKARGFVNDRILEDVTSEQPYSVFTQNGRLGRVYRLVDKFERKKRAQALFKALSVLRGGAKQAQFGTDISPKAMIVAGLTCGNPIFNHLFDANETGQASLDVRALQEIVKDYADRIVTPVFVGIRTGYLTNENEIRALPNALANRSDGSVVELRITTPVEAANSIGESLT